MYVCVCVCVHMCIVFLCVHVCVGVFSGACPCGSQQLFTRFLAQLIFILIFDKEFFSKLGTQ